MIRILFTTEHREQHYTIQAVNMLSGLNEFDGVQIDFFDTDYQKYDVILFMGYDPRVLEARASNPRSRIGVIDPRSVTEDVVNADFIVAQGIEEMNWASDYVFDICRYDIYPIPHGRLKTHVDKKNIIIGYHGNKIHLQTMFPHLSTAIEALAEHYHVEFWAMYNIQGLGELPFDPFPGGKVKYRPIQWEWDGFERYFTHVDIGVIPNLLPIYHLPQARKNIESFPTLFYEQDTDYLLRFKCTSNIARLYPFVILGIPVVADFFPSACHTIQNGITGFIGGSTGMWYRGLVQLTASATLRQEIADRMYQQYLQTATPVVFNRNLLRFLKKIVARPPQTIPSVVTTASKRLDDLVEVNAKFLASQNDLVKVNAKSKNKKIKSLQRILTFPARVKRKLLSSIKK